MYPELEIGTYTHIAHSLHVYERDFDKIEAMMENEFKLHGTPTLDVDFIDERGNTSGEITEIIQRIEGTFPNPEYGYGSNSFILRWLYGNARNK